MFSDLDAAPVLREFRKRALVPLTRPRTRYLLGPETKSPSTRDPLARHERALRQAQGQSIGGGGGNRRRLAEGGLINEEGRRPDNRHRFARVSQDIRIRSKASRPVKQGRMVEAAGIEPASE